MEDRYGFLVGKGSMLPSRDISKSPRSVFTGKTWSVEEIGVLYKENLASTQPKSGMYFGRPPLAHKVMFIAV